MARTSNAMPSQHISALTLRMPLVSLMSGASLKMPGWLNPTPRAPCPRRRACGPARKTDRQPHPPRGFSGAAPLPPGIRGWGNWGPPAPSEPAQPAENQPRHERPGSQRLRGGNGNVRVNGHACDPQLGRVEAYFCQWPCLKGTNVTIPTHWGKIGVERSSPRMPLALGRGMARIGASDVPIFRPPSPAH